MGSAQFMAESVDFPDIRHNGTSVMEALEYFTNEIENRTWEENRVSKHTEPKIEAECGVLDVNCFLIPVKVFKKHKDFPKIVYLYQKFERYIPTMLAEPYVWFSRKEHFNDPFEGGDVFSGEYAPLEKLNDFCNYHRDYCNNHGIPYNHDECMAKFYTLSIHEPKDLEDFFRELLERKTQSFNAAAEGFVITCFSRLYDSTLMWSHYADKHRGLVIGFDSSFINATTSLASDIEYRNTKELVSPGKIPFSRHDDKIPPEVEAFVIDVLRRRYLTKHSFWRYEQEIRVIRQGDVGPYKLPDDAIKEVYFGLNMDRALRDMLVSFLQERRGIELFNMEFADQNRLARKKILCP